jgi:putative acetyltransferase
MIQEPIFYNTKKNQEIEFRTPNSSEAQAVLDAMIEISESCPYILSTPDSFRARTIDSQVKWMEDSIESQTSIIIAAYFNGKIIGFSNAESFKNVKRRHTASLGISLHPDFRGCGLGRKMMEVLIESMKKFTEIKIIALDVMVNNIGAVKLYENLGFKKAGVFPKAFILQSGEVSDNLTMYMEV